MRTSGRGAGVHFLESSQVHRRIEQRQNVWVKGLPVGVVKVVFLGLQFMLTMYFNGLRIPISCQAKNMLLR